MRHLKRILLVIYLAGSGCTSGGEAVPGVTTLVLDPSTSTTSGEVGMSAPPVPTTTVPLGEAVSPLTEDALSPGEQEAFVYLSVAGVEVEYLLYLPDDYDRTKAWPVIISLHGFLGFSDQTIRTVGEQNPLVWVSPAMDFPFVLISPLRPDEGPWHTLHEPLQQLLDEMRNILGLKAKAVFLTGLSTGALGTWQWALEYPEAFTGIAPVEGDATLGGDPVPPELCRLVDLPVWAGHGREDSRVPLERHAAVVDALRDCGSSVVQFTVYEDLDHSASIAAFYGGPDLYDWMIQTISDASAPSG